MVDEENKRIRRLTDDAEKMLPTYSTKAERMTPEEVRQDFETATVSGERPQRLKEWKAQFGLRRAAFMFADWVIENENASNT
jgi:hypothetical protein